MKRALTRRGVNGTRIALIALGIAVGGALGVQACSSTAPPAGRGPVAPPAVATPLGPPPAPPEATPLVTPEGAPPSSGAALDVWGFTPLLGAPELKQAAEAFSAEDYATTAALVSEHVQKLELSALDRARWSLLLARVREKAGDYAGASEAYARASELDWALRDYAALGLGRALLALSELDPAESALLRVSDDSAAHPSALGLLAEVSCRKGEVGACLDRAKRFASRPRKPNGWSIEAFQLAQLLVDQLAVPRVQGSAIDDQVEALAYVRMLIREAPNAAQRFDAPKLEQRLVSVLPDKLRTERRRSTEREQLDRLEAVADAGRNEQAAALADGLLRELGDRAYGPVACQARLTHGKVLFHLKQRVKASERFAQVLRHCKGESLRASALYLGGRSAFQDTRYEEAARLFAQLEKELPRHRLADDARLYRAQAHRERGDEARFSELLGRMPDDYPSGDMTLDGVFLLATARMEKHDWAGASRALTRATQLAERSARLGLEHSGRERYFAARAHIETGDVERGLAEYEAIIAEYPLSYYMLHAYSRLWELDNERAARALAAALDQSTEQPFVVGAAPELQRPEFLRGLELLRQSNIDEARREFELGGLHGSKAPPSVLWSLAALYARVGSARHSHALPRWQLVDWLERWPTGSWRQAWELAFPRPHMEAVNAEAKRQGLGPELVYAIMREESAFDPGAVSPANAFGLMQIISPTARRFGKEAGLPYDRKALTTPNVSIAIGTRVLSNYMEYFPRDPLLAIPGYNAGPGRPMRWVRDFAGVDFDVWVELIPFRETRRYTKRVLASRGAYGFLYYGSGEQDPLLLPRRLSANAALAGR